MSTSNFAKEKNYWLGQLSGEWTKSYFPYDSANNGQTCQRKQVSFVLGDELSRQIIKTSGGSDHRVYMILLAAIKGLLYKYTGSEDITIGAPIFTQTREGEYINTVLAYRSRLSGEEHFKQWVRKVGETVQKGTEHQNYPLESLCQQVKPGENVSEGLFDLIVLLQNVHKREYIEHLQTNMLFAFSKDLERISGVVEYNASLYQEATVERICRHLQSLLTGVFVDLGKPLQDVVILSDAEIKEILFDFNATARELPQSQVIHAIFERKVLKDPEAEAVVYQDQRLTYGELNEWSNRLARKLRQNGVIADTVVGLLVDRSVEMIVGMLAILKAGGAYLPIDPSYPENRIRTMLLDSEARILLTRDPIVERLAYTALQNLDTTLVEPVCTQKRAQIMDLDSLPIPDRTLIDYDKYNQYIGHAKVKNAMVIQATRGCPYHCAYCHKIWPKTHIVRSAENIFQEVELLYHLGIKRFAFVDDIFNLDQENSSRFFQQIIDHGFIIQLFFTNGLRGDILTEEYIDLMAQAGTVNITLSLETASPRLQKMLKKNIDLEKLRKNIEYIATRHPHIILQMNTILGFPTETEDEAMKTLNYIKSLKWVHFPYVHILKIYPDTEMAQIALENGVSAEAIMRSAELAFHELPETLPFSKAFARNYQAKFLNEYFLLKERLLAVLPYQMQVFSEDELLQRYSAYLPVELKSFTEFLAFCRIAPEELSTLAFCSDAEQEITGLHEKMKPYFPNREPASDALRILLLDLSLHYSEDRDLVYDIVEPPLGLMYLLTYVNREFGEKVQGKIAKARIDFDSDQELQKLIEEFQPDVIGLRSLTYYRDFYHKTIANIRQWGIQVPIIAGGPYATSSYGSILQDRNIDLVVIGEGEVTFSEIIGKMIANGTTLDETILKDIAGIAYMPKRTGLEHRKSYQILTFDQLQAESAEGSCDNLEMINTPADLAYVIYTSGSTGKPKGIMVEHRNVLNLIHGLKEIVYAEDPAHRNVALVAPYVFDASVQQIFAALLLGHTLHIVPDEVKLDADRFSEFYQQNTILVSDGTPAHLNIFLKSAHSAGSRLPVKHFLIGGEALQTKVVEKFIKQYGHPEMKITNVYGPAECCVDSTAYTLEANSFHQELPVVPIGKPLPNVKIYILGKQREVLPMGVPGDIYIAGAGVSRGYINQPELTRERFISHPLCPDERWYWTGDVGRWLPDGNIEFLGRIDHQVKIRGYRIELREIENSLLKHPGITETVVVDFADAFGNRNLAAYLVMKQAYSWQEIREFLAQELPEYMIPAYFVRLESIPITLNGKVDRRQLPDPLSQISQAGEYTAPRNELETILVNTWQEVLGVQRIGIHDNFFNLGGDSIKAIMILAHLHGYRLKVDMAQLFQTPTIAELSQHVQEGRKRIDQGIVSGQVELTPIQCWFFEQGFIDPHYWNNTVLLYSKTGLDEERVKRVFDQIVTHHDALRMVFTDHEGRIRQWNRPLEDNLYSFQIFDLREVAVYEEAMQIQGDILQWGMNLSTGPLMVLGLFHTVAGDYLQISIHHLVIDGISWRILLEDFERGYQQLTQGCELSLLPTTDSFQRWAAQLVNYAQSPALLQEIAYWTDLEQVKLTPLPKDREKAEKKHEYRSVSTQLSAEDTSNLLKNANQAYHTEINDLLLTALARAVKEWSGLVQIGVDLEGHGREEILKDCDISRTIGWFTSIYPVILDLSQTDELGGQIKQIKEKLRKIPHKGVGYGIIRYLTAPEHKANLTFCLRPEISFNYLGQFEPHSDGKVQMIQQPHLTKADPASTHLLHITGMVTQQKLTLQLNYSLANYTNEMMEYLADRLKQQLCQLIEHCLTVTDAELTPADLTYKELTLEEFDELADLIN